MTFRQALNSLRANGESATKRPSMRGYVFKEQIVPAEGEPDTEAETILVRADGMRVVLGKDEVVLTSELFDAIVVADDWELAPKAALEKARAGEGTL